MATKVSLKLLIDQKNRKVLFAEAGKDFVDFLFNLLTLPLGTVIRLLTKNNMVGSLGKLYESIQNLNETYMQQEKDCLLKPRAPYTTTIEAPLLLSDADSLSRKFYKCAYCHQYVADKPNMICPNKHTMNQEVSFVDQVATNRQSSSGAKGGFVKGVVTYMIMDDLEVRPMSTISSITLLNKFHVQEIGALEEKVFDLGMSEGLKLLKVSLQSNTVLTTVFLGSKEAA